MTQPNTVSKVIAQMRNVVPDAGAAWTSGDKVHLTFDGRRTRCCSQVRGAAFVPSLATSYPASTVCRRCFGEVVAA